jgi:hypothetical protein
MERSFASRVRGAIGRWRHRWVYEHVRPQLSLTEIVGRMEAPHAAATIAHPFASMLAAHLSRMPRGLWDNAPSASGADVERARKGEWTLFGRTITVSPATDWHCDPIFGARWPRHYVGAISYHRSGGDLVTLWHLNKTMFLLDVAAAYRSTRDAELAARAYQIIDSWCAANPYLVGINWASPMDIATRLAVWSQTLAALADAPPPAEERAARIVRSILRQADYLTSHFSEWPIPNNHLVGESALLYVFASYWPLWKDSPAWLRRAEATLVAEAQRQVLEDGVHYEGSVNYHVYTLDYFLMYLHAKALLDEPPHPVILNQTRAMAAALMELVMPSGRFPRIGDDSIDRCFVLAYATDGPALAPDSNAFADYVRPAYMRLFAATDWGRDLLKIRVPTRHARHFADAGISVARDSDAAVVFVHGPQHRHLFSHGHLHADAGSFELELDGAPVIVDPGTYVYYLDPDARRFFKSSHAHNAPVIDDIEPMPSTETFRWENVASGEHLGFAAAAGVVAIGNRRKLGGAFGAQLEHTRTFVISAGTVLVLDAIRNRQRSSDARHTHLARVCFRTPTPRTSASVDGSRVRIADAHHFARIVEAFSNQPLHVDAMDDPRDRVCWYSRWYTDLQHGVAVVTHTEFEDSVALLSTVRRTDVDVLPVRLDAADTTIAIETHGTRRLVRVQADPYTVVVGGRTMIGRGADAARFALPRAVTTAGSSTPDWLDELASGSH